MSFKLDLADGKYTLIQEDKPYKLVCLRHGEEWRDLVGDNLIVALADKILDLQNEIAAVKGKSSKSEEFVKSIAELKIWGEPDEDGNPFEPSDGLDDSHQCLMSKIEEAREIIFADEWQKQSELEPESTHGMTGI